MQIAEVGCGMGDAGCEMRTQGEEGRCRGRRWDEMQNAEAGGRCRMWQRQVLCVENADGDLDVDLDVEAG